MSRRWARGTVWLLVGGIAAGGCSLRQTAASKVGDALAGGGAGWSSEEDPELVREALPFTLKLMESLAAEAPRHAGLRLALCRGFASYAAGFLEPDADEIEPSDFERAKALRERARKLHLRGRGYCLQAFDIGQPGTGARLLAGDAGTLSGFAREDVELLFWTGVSWGSAIGLGLDRPELVADLPQVRAIFERALALDDGFDRGSLHEAMIVFDSFPAVMGGSLERARAHYDRAIELAQGRRAGPHVTWALKSTVSRQARREFEESLAKALAVDPDAEPADRLINLIAQERARLLRARADDYFFTDEGKGTTE